MKLRLVPILAALLMGTPLVAQIAGPPALIDYQGRLLNSVGGPLTSPDISPGIATNYEIRFRIWDAQSGGNLLWAEKQIVTVTGDGLFSVRLGEGEEITVAAGDPLALTGSVPNGPGALLGTFDGKERFLGVTVMNPPATPGEIQPRLSFLASPYAINAEKARFAEFGPSTGPFIASQLGIGTPAPSTNLHVSLGASGATARSDSRFLIEDDTNAYASIMSPANTWNGWVFSRPGQETSGGMLYSNTNALHFHADGATRMTILPNGNVGIGTGAPDGPLHVWSGNSGVAPAGLGVVLEDDTSNWITFQTPAGVSSGLLMRTPNSSQAASLRFNETSGGTPAGSLMFGVGMGDPTRMVITGNGNVGIGISNPSEKLEIAGNIRFPENVAATVAIADRSGSAPGQALTLRAGGAAATNFANRGGDVVIQAGIGNSNDNDANHGGGNVVIRSGGNRLGSVATNNFQAIRFETGFQNLHFERMRIKQNGFVGIGTTDPSHLLHVNGVARSVQANFATTSDRRVKRNIAKVDEGESLEKIMSLKPVTFEYSEAYKLGRTEYEGSFTGFVAQEIEEVFPEMVDVTVELVGEETFGDFRLLNTSEMIPHLVAALQEAHRNSANESAKRDLKIMALKQEVAELKARDAARDERLSMIEALLKPTDGENLETVSNKGR